MKYTDNMMTYLKWRGDLPFAAVPLGTVDSMILAELVYLDWEGIVPRLGDRRRITLRDAAKRYSARYLAELPLGDYTTDQELLMAISRTERFGQLLLCNFVDDTDLAEEKQFAAMHVEFGNDQTYIVFRGTDGTLVGWKENFNMSYRMPVPSQQEAVDYVNRTAVLPDMRYWIGGHSKGGNLAVYAATYCEREVQARICGVYTFDSPGFYKRIWEETEFTPIREKLQAFVPEASIVGMLLEHFDRYRVVKSSEVGVSQHLLCSWQVDGPDLLYVPRRDSTSYFLEENIHEWIGRIPMNERKPFVDAFFSVLESTGIERFSDFKNISFKKIKNVIRAMTSISQENRDTITRIVHMIQKDVMGVAELEEE